MARKSGILIALQLGPCMVCSQEDIMQHPSRARNKLGWLRECYVQIFTPIIAHRLRNSAESDVYACRDERAIITVTLPKIEINMFPMITDKGQTQTHILPQQVYERILAVLQFELQASKCTSDL
jgi:hypothetical protein